LRRDLGFWLLVLAVIAAEVLCIFWL